MLEEQGRLGPRSRFHKWSPLTRAELWGFLAIVLNMGIIRLPDIESYWKTGTTPKKIDKIKPLLDLLLPCFQQLYSPSRNLAIDGTMVGFHGRFGSIQYVPQKPTKVGHKSFHSS